MDSLKKNKVKLFKYTHNKTHFIGPIINIFYGCFIYECFIGNTAYEEKGLTNQNYNFELLSYDLDKKSTITRDEEEAFIIGNDIINKLINIIKRIKRIINIEIDIIEIF